MTMPALYEIGKEYLEALEALTDPELDIPLDAISDTLEGIEGQLQEKATNVAKFMRSLEATASAIKEAEQKMAQRRKAIESRADWLKDYLKRNMEHSGITKIESPWFVLSIQKNPPSVVIDDESLIPDEFKSEVVTVKIDKASIKKACASGEVSGAHLEQGTRLSIK